LEIKIGTFIAPAAGTGISNTDGIYVIDANAVTAVTNCEASGE